MSLKNLKIERRDPEEDKAYEADLNKLGWCLSCQGMRQDLESGGDCFNCGGTGQVLELE